MAQQAEKTVSSSKERPCYAASVPTGAATILSVGRYGAIVAIAVALAWSQALHSSPLPCTGAVRKTTWSALPGLLLSLSIVFYSSSLFAQNTRPLSQAQSPPSASKAPDVPPSKTPLASNPKPHWPVTRFPDPTGITGLSFPSTLFGLLSCVLLPQAQVWSSNFTPCLKLPIEILLTLREAPYSLMHSRDLGTSCKKAVSCRDI